VAEEVQTGTIGRRAMSSDDDMEVFGCGCNGADADPSMMSKAGLSGRPNRRCSCDGMLEAVAMASTAEAGDDGGECSGSNWNTSVTLMGLICVEEVARSSAERHGGDAPSSAEM